MPYIDMNQPWIYMCWSSRSPLPSPTISNTCFYLNLPHHVNFNLKSSLSPHFPKHWLLSSLFLLMAPFFSRAMGLEDMESSVAHSFPLTPKFNQQSQISFYFFNSLSFLTLTLILKSVLPWAHIYAIGQTHFSNTAHCVILPFRNFQWALVTP